MKMKRDSKPLIIGIAIILILIILVFVTNKKNNDTDTYEGMTDEEIEVTVKEKCKWDEEKRFRWNGRKR